MGEMGKFTKSPERSASMRKCIGGAAGIGCAQEGDIWVKFSSSPTVNRDGALPGATQPNSVLSYDFVHDQLVDVRALKMLCVIDEYPRECLAIEVGASLSVAGCHPDAVATHAAVWHCPLSTNNEISLRRRDRSTWNDAELICLHCAYTLSIWRSES